MKIVITGGAGFIGHNAAIYLKGRGYDVVAIDNLKRSTKPAEERLRDHGVPLFKWDVLRTKGLINFFDGAGVVVHAAAYINVEESMRKPTLYFTNNVAGTVSVAEACLRRGAKLIYLSSAAVYGDPKLLPISEDHPTDPISPYGLSKLMGEGVVKFYAGRGLRYIILRPFNAYGLGQSGPYAGVVSRFLEEVSKGRPPRVYGDGQQTRDFIHVEDLVEAIRLAIESQTTNETFNIASGRPTKIADLARIVIKIFGQKTTPKHTNPKPGEIRHSLADISKAQRILGFSPRISLEQGLLKIIGNSESLAFTHRSRR